MDDWKEQYSDDPEVVIGWIKAVYLMSDGDWCDCVRRVAAARDKEITRLRAELETERMRLVACSVIALANTTESAARARDMHPDYQSPYCDDVARAVDREIALRAENEALRDALISIEEYWNRDQNEKAMADACWHAVETAHAALAAKEE